MPITLFVRSRIKLSPDVLYQQLIDESVLLDLVSERYIGLDPVGTRIWQLLGDDGDPEYVIAKMLEEYDVDETRLRNDLLTFVENLSAEGLLTVESTS